MLCIGRIIIEPNIEKLVECGLLLAERLSLPSPADSEFRNKITEILYERDNYEAAVEGIITKGEMATLLMQHFQTLICRLAESEAPGKPFECDDIEKLMVKAIFG